MAEPVLIGDMLDDVLRRVCESAGLPERLADPVPDASSPVCGPVAWDDIPGDWGPVG